MNRWPVLRPDYELRGGLDVKYQDPVNRSEVSVYYLPTAAQRVHTCQFSISSSLVRRVILEEFRLKGSGLSVTRALQPIRTSQWIFRTKNPKSGCFVFLNEKLKISGWRASIDGVICPVQSNETNSQSFECWIWFTSWRVLPVNTVPRGCQTESFWGKRRVCLQHGTQLVS